MATSVFLGEGYVTLTVRDAAYTAAIRRAEIALGNLAAKWNAAFGGAGSAAIGTATARMRAFDMATRLATTTVHGMTRAVAGMNAAMRGGSASGIASVIRAVGAAQAAMTRATGAAMASVSRASQATAIAQVRSSGQVAMTSIRSGFALLNTGLRGSFSVVNTGMRTTASVLRAAVSPVTAAIAGVTRMGSGLIGRLGLIGGVGGGLSAGLFGKTAITEAMTMELRMANLGRITQGTAAQIAELKQRLTGLASTMPGVKTADIFGTATMASKMGVGQGKDGSFDPRALSLFTRDLSKMSLVLEDIPIDTAVEKIGRLITVFELGHGDAIRFASSLNALDIASTASAADILDITTRFAGMAHAFKMSAADAMALATALRQAGIPLETAGTATSQIIARMASKRDSTQFGKLAGTSGKGFSKMLEKDSLGAMTAVLQGMKKIEETKGPVALSRVMDKLHLDGQRVRAAFLQMIPAVDELDRYLGISRREFETLDSVEQGFAAKSATAWAQVQLMKNNFLLMAAAIGERFLPIIRAAAEAIGQVAEDIRASFEGDAGKAVQAWAESVAAKVQYLGLVFREFPTFVDLANSHLQEFRDQFATVWTRIGMQAQTAMTGMEQMLGAVVDRMGMIIGNMAVVFMNAIVGLTTLINSIAVPIGQNLGQGILKGMSKALDAQFGKNIGWILNKVVGRAGPGTKGLGDIVGGWIDSNKDKPPVPVKPDASGITPKALFNNTQKIPGLPGLPGVDIAGLFKGLPNRRDERIPMNDRLQRAEEQLLAARKGNAEAAEDEARALRVKKDGPMGPPLAGANPAVQERMARGAAGRNRRVAAAQARAKRQMAARKALGFGEGGVGSKAGAEARAAASAKARAAMGMGGAMDRFGKPIARKKRATYQGNETNRVKPLRDAIDKALGGAPLLPGETPGFRMRGMLPPVTPDAAAGGIKMPGIKAGVDGVGLATEKEDKIQQAQAKQEELLQAQMKATADNTSTVAGLSKMMERLMREGVPQRFSDHA